MKRYFLFAGAFLAPFLVSANLISGLDSYECKSMSMKNNEIRALDRARMHPIEYYSGMPAREAVLAFY